MWNLQGTYLEACNCEAICPCRRVSGTAVGRSTYGICLGALSWAIEAGELDGVDLGDLRVVMSIRFDDDEPGSPWDFVLYLDENADERQREALTSIYLGHAGGTPMKQFPWALKPSRLIETRIANIEIDHTPRRGWFRVGRELRVTSSAPVEDQEPVTCLIPGHHRTGTELVMEELHSSAAPVLDFDFSGKCGYESTFAYSSDG